MEIHIFLNGQEINVKDIHLSEKQTSAIQEIIEN